MRILFTAIVAASLFGAFSLAENSTTSQPIPTSQSQKPAPSGPPAEAPRLAAGSVIPVELIKTVDAKKVRAGDEVDVKVIEDLKTQNGQLLMPKDTKIVGHVTEAQTRTKQQKESELGITFDRALLKEGGDVTLPASIQAVIAPPNQNPNTGNLAGAAPTSPTPGGFSPGGGRTGMSGEPSPGPGSYPSPGASAAGGEPNNVPPGNNANPPITSKTEGVIGMSNYKLSTPGDEKPGDKKQGSVVSSEKSNVKLESGTLMLLRVHQ